MPNQTMNTRQHEVDITVLVTCFDEQDYIRDTLNTVSAALKNTSLSYEIIVIDDRSQDRSVEQINAYIEEHPDEPVQLHQNQKNRGLANNFIDGAFMGTGKYYRLCCGDNAETQESLENLFAYTGKADIVLSHQNQKEVKGKSPYRKILSTLFGRVVNLISGYKIKYYNGCPIFLRFHVMRWSPVTLGFGFQADIIVRLLDEGFSYTEVDLIEGIDRKGGAATAISLRNVLSVLHTLLEIVFRRIRGAIYKEAEASPKEIK